MRARLARILRWTPLLLCLLRVEGGTQTTNPPAPEFLGGNRPFYVGLLVDAERISIRAEGELTGEERPSGRTLRWKSGEVSFSSEPAKGSIDVAKWGEGWWRVRAPDDGHPLHLNGRSYRGSICVVRSKRGGLIAINELEVDDYLKGVLPRESVPTWPIEALKVQAVTSRTFLSSHLARHGADRFDVCASTHCQMYIGRSREDARTNRAIDETADEILFYKGKPTLGYFYSSCGGMTETAEAVWLNKRIPYLKRRPCRWGADAAWYRWRAALTASDILASLKAAGRVDGTILKDVKVLRRSGSKRASEMRVVTDAGTFNMSGDAFRYAMNGDYLRSTLFTLKRDADGGYVFEGTGWGHGVGMCQWGSRGQAEEGRGYREILDFYFPGTTIGRWSGPKQARQRKT